MYPIANKYQLKSRGYGSMYLGGARRRRLLDEVPDALPEALERCGALVPRVLLVRRGKVVVESGQRLPVLLVLGVVSPAAGLDVQLREAPELQLLNTDITATISRIHEHIGTAFSIP